METQNKTAEELREENIRSIVEQVQIWQETDPQNRTAILILNEDIDEKTRATEFIEGKEINLMAALDHFHHNKNVRKIFSKLIAIKTMFSGDE